jgi:hypothetical protein
VSPLPNFFLHASKHPSSSWCVFLPRLNILQPAVNTKASIMAALGSLLLVTLFFVVALSETDRCYFPNGELGESAARCWDATLGPTSLCCQSGDLCLNNTLCANMNGGRYTTYYRGSCISSSWSDPGCPKFCDNPFEDDQIVQVLPCSDAQPPTRWGCGGDCFELSGALLNLTLLPLFGLVC